MRFRLNKLGLITSTFTRKFAQKADATFPTLNIKGDILGEKEMVFFLFK